VGGKLFGMVGLQLAQPRLEGIPHPGAPVPTLFMPDDRTPGDSQCRGGLFLGPTEYFAQEADMLTRRHSPQATPHFHLSCSGINDRLL
jgi:hypothetical protein